MKCPECKEELNEIRIYTKHRHTLKIIDNAVRYEVDHSDHDDEFNSTCMDSIDQAATKEQFDVECNICGSDLTEFFKDNLLSSD